MREGIYLKTTGTQLNTGWATSAGNYVAGHYLFRRTRDLAPLYMGRYLK